MISLARRWSLPAALVTAALALSACAGNSGSPVPLAPNQFSPAGFHEFTQLHATSEGMFGATCPKQYLACFTVSLAKGLVIHWCDGTKANPCGTTKNYKWSGNVCKATATKCSEIPQFTVKWTGPFPCSKNPKDCVGGTTKGYYETDTIGIGATPPKITMSYLYKQEIALNGKAAAYIGLNVGM